jgi:hypothetical protein
MAKKSTSDIALNPIALLALVVSLCTMLTSVYQARLQRKEQFASVWPHLNMHSLTKTNDTSFTSGIRITNDGVGPGVIQAITFRFNGQPVAELGTLLDSLCAEFDPKEEGELDGLVNSIIEPGTFFPAGRELVWFETSRRLAALPKLRHRIEKIEIYVRYASIYNEQWTVCYGCSDNHVLNQKRLE